MRRPEEGKDHSDSADLSGHRTGRLTRRELRKQELEARPTAEEGDVARRAVPSTSTKARKQPRRTARIRGVRKAVRRDAVRQSSTPKSLGARVFSVGAMLFAGALAFGMTIPANAFGTATEEQVLADSMTQAAQSLAVTDAQVPETVRDGWTVTSWAEMLRLRYGNRSFDYEISDGAVRWPFPYAVPISSGFGNRAAPCYGCSTMHSGIDFSPGAGAAIFAIADGVVEVSDDGYSSWGNYVVIRHEIDGETFFSGYAHMQRASSPLVAGEEIKVGDFVGLVGATGQVTGSHLHLTISQGEQHLFIDPYTFLQTHTAAQ